MEVDMIGTTFVEQLSTQCRIGCTEEERRAWQPILIDLTCEVEMQQAVGSDTREDCVDYCALHAIALELAQTTSYQLLERLAYDVAVKSLALKHVLAVTIRIRKPYKLAGCEAVGITLRLTREDVQKEVRDGN